MDIFYFGGSGREVLRMALRKSDYKERGKSRPDIKKPPLLVDIFYFGGPGGIRTPEAEAKDLQSSPFDRSGTDPKMEPPIGFEPMTCGLQDRRSTS